MYAFVSSHCEKCLYTEWIMPFSILYLLKIYKIFARDLCGRTSEAHRQDYA
jgi:hypothetical protein